MTNQAKRIRDALKAIGLRDRKVWKPEFAMADFSVRTDGNGNSANGWGDAYAVLYNERARQLVASNAERLVEMGVTVKRGMLAGGFHVLVSSSYPPRIVEWSEK